MKEKLLPNYYKRIGLIFGSLSLIFLITNFFTQEFLNINQEIIEWILKDLLLISLLLITFTREKVESEKVMEIRYHKLKQSILFGGSVLILDSILELFSHYEKMEMKSGYHIMIMILLFYLVTFNFRKNNYT